MAKAPEVGSPEWQRADYARALEDELVAVTAQGKGERIKAGDDRAFALCADQLGKPGCHHAMGTAGTFTRDARRRLERQAVAYTQHVLIERSASDPKLRAVLVKVRLLPPLELA